MDKQCPPPMLFSDLKDEYADKSIITDIDYLLDLKIHSQEKQIILAIQNINDYISDTMNEIKTYLNGLPKNEPKSWDTLNEFFLSEITYTSIISNE